ncbi:E3 ubiquitin-protein ligase rnf8-B-like [Musca vetustissima]|uniref:E3 ubiquitin-protein ligase rnf8-B-like n=1 Tax=Musca vetustissima TaxID=27455 RepID=UPI002AB7DC70|nr:E3 ubiquitin-protein ligase rnf8-B-like [Musca vetustissima]
MTDLKVERCVLCLDAKHLPVTIHCGHSFCGECLKRYKSYKKHTWAKKCPICRSEFKDKKRMKPSSSLEISSNATSVDTMNENSLLEQFIAMAADDGEVAIKGFQSRISVNSISGSVDNFEEGNDDDFEPMDDDDSDEDIYYYFEDDVSSYHNLESNDAENVIIVDD